MKSKAAETISKLEVEKEALKVENSLFERLQNAYTDGYNKAIQTIQMFQGASRGPPPSAHGLSFMPVSSASGSSRSSASPPPARQ